MDVDGSLAVGKSTWLRDYFKSMGGKYGSKKDSMSYDAFELQYGRRKVNVKVRSHDSSLYVCIYNINNSINFFCCDMD